MSAYVDDSGTVGWRFGGDDSAHRVRLLVVVMLDVFHKNVLGTARAILKHVTVIPRPMHCQLATRGHFAKAIAAPIAIESFFVVNTRRAPVREQVITFSL